MPQLISSYSSPLGQITFAIDGGTLIGLWFNGQRHFGSTIDASRTGFSDKTTEDQTVATQTLRWLDAYFGVNPELTELPYLPPIRMIGTPFQVKVWQHLQQIPHGETTNYGQIAKQLGTSARAIGGAVGRNPLLLIVPCHRVINADGSLGGFAAGTEIKTQLLSIEKNGTT